MAITIGGSNITSLQTQKSLGDATSKLAKAFKQLSSGLRINDASDDPAGLALAAALNSKAEIFSVGVRNVNDGISQNNVAQSALTALNQISQRQLELAQQAANGTYTSTQRAALDTEASALTDEYNRIVTTTTFNGKNLFDGTLGTIKIQAGDSAIAETFGQLSSIGSGTTSTTVTTVVNVGDGTFTSAQTYKIGSTLATLVRLADVNGDGNQDIITADKAGNISVLLGNGNGTFQSAGTFKASVTNADTVSIADFNHDGKLDAIVTAANGTADIMLGNGDGTFGAAKSFQISGDDFGAALGDLNGDGNLDIVSEDYANHITNVMLGNGDGTFKANKTISGGVVNGYAVSLADMNGDGSLDILLSDVTHGGVSVLLSNGDGTFKAAKTYTSGGDQELDLTIADFNGDGYLDVATAENTTEIGIFFGNGDGTLKSVVNYQTSAGSGGAGGSIVSADFNGDGKIDIVVENDFTNNVSVLLNNGNGTFAAAKTFAAITGTEDVQVGDVNNDGRADFIVTSQTVTSVAVLIGNGGTASHGTTTTTPLGIDLTTQANAIASEVNINANIAKIEAQLGSLGATNSRFHFAIDNLQVQSENYAAAASKITDVDVAETTAQLIRQQILQQTSAALLAQANLQPSLVLKLLR